MIVQCENCETRFHVADARIPEKGARVRCSRCHHRFHITPSSAAAGPSPAADVSAREPERGPTPAPASPAPASPGAEDELDNPEFLFDENSTSRDGGTASRPAPRAEAPPAAKRAAPAEAAPAAAPAEEPPAEPPLPLEQHIVETHGKTAQEMLDMGAPKLDAKPVEFAGGLGASGPPEDFFSEEGAPEPAQPAPAVKLTPVGKSAPAPKPAPPPKPEPSLDLDAGFAGALGEDEPDETDAGWDSLTKSEDESPRSVFDAGASFGLQTESDGAAPAQGGSGATMFSHAEPEANTKERRAPDVPAFDPEAGSPLARVVRVAAFLVGVALLAGTLRGLELQSAAKDASGSAEQAAGWIAADVETFVARDGAGQRVLVVRGNLFPDGAAPPPDVEVSLLETDGARVGEPRRAWLERLDDAEIAPDELSVRLASSAGELSGVGPKVTGFTALLADPPARARRVQVSLSAGRMPVPGTATAGTPAPPAPAPARAPAAETQLATPQAAPPANPPASGGSPGSDPVVPAAPAPAPD